MPIDSDSWISQASQLTANISTGHVSPKDRRQIKLHLKFNQLAAYLPFFSSCFTVKRSPSLEDPSIGDGIVISCSNYVQRCFSGKVAFTSHASLPYEHAETEL